MPTHAEKRHLPYTPEQLFDLEDDPNEKKNLASAYPEKVKEMAKRLEQEYSKIKLKK